VENAEGQNARERSAGERSAVTAVPAASAAPRRVSTHADGAASVPLTLTLRSGAAQHTAALRRLTRR
jgi:hypothetical protein